MKNMNRIETKMII